ncbi:MAG TPA: hypothetical protein VFE65_07065 [Pseudonocardia sp.]|nr:hypothetical protein [Pseudonocardia sp.]
MRKITATLVIGGAVAALLALGGGLATARPSDQLIHRSNNDLLGGRPVGSMLPPGS